MTTRTQSVTTRHPSFGALRAFSMLNGLVLLGVLLQGVWGGGILGRAGGVDWAFLHELTGSVTVLCSLAATILAVTTLRRHRDVDGDQTIGKVSHACQEVWSPVSYCPRSSLPAHVLDWLADRLAHLLPPRPPGQGGTPPLSLEVRLDAVAAVLLDGLSYRRAGRVVGISKTEVGDSLDLLLGPLGDLGFCQPDGTFITSLDDLRHWLWEMARSGEAVCLDGLATRVQRPRGWANQKVLYDAKRHGHTAQGLAISTTHGDLLWLDGGWPGSCHEHELLALAGLEGVLDDIEVASLLDRGFRGMAKTREHWHAPVGDRRTKDRLTDAQRAFNRVQAGLRALVEQSIAHLANAWSLRRWRGLLCRVRDVYQAAGALICLGRWLHRVPT